MNDQSISAELIQSNEDSSEILELHFSNLSGQEKLTLVLIPVVLAFQAFYLFNLSLLSEIFKGMIKSPYKPVADYATAFLNTLVPYLLLLFVFLSVFFSFTLLVKDEATIKMLNQGYFYLGVAIFTDFILLFMSISTNNPYTTELFLFLFMILLSGFIAFLPFGVNDLLDQREKRVTTSHMTNI